MASNSILNKTELNRYFNSGLADSTECLNRDEITAYYPEAQIISAVGSGRLVPDNGELFIRRSFRYGASLDAAFDASPSIFYINDTEWDTTAAFSIRLNGSRFYHSTAPSMAYDGYYLFQDDGNWKFYEVSNGRATRFVTVDSLSINILSGVASGGVDTEFTFEAALNLSDGTAINVTSSATYNYDTSKVRMTDHVSYKSAKRIGYGSSVIGVSWRSFSDSISVAADDYPVNITMPSALSVRVSRSMSIFYSVTMASGEERSTGALASSDDTSVATATTRIGEGGIKVTGVGVGMTTVRGYYTAGGVLAEASCMVTVTR